MTFSMRFLATGLCVVAVSAITAVLWWRSTNVDPVQRGADLALAQGCLGCHGGPRLSLVYRGEASMSSLEARTRLDEITRLIVEKLLLTPTEQLKSVSNGTMSIRYADALNRLFQLAVDDKGESLSKGSETAVSTR